MKLFIPYVVGLGQSKLERLPLTNLGKMAKALLSYKTKLYPSTD